MIASMGLLVQELVTGQGIWEQLSSGNVSPPDPDIDAARILGTNQTVCTPK